MTTYRGTRLEKPLPAHAMTPDAEDARASVREYGRRREAARLEALAAAGGEGQAADYARLHATSAQRVDLDELSGSPKAVAARLASLSARVATTSANGERLSVWAVMPGGRRVRAMYHRTATGWGSDGVIVDGLAYGVTAALKMLSEAKP